MLALYTRVMGLLRAEAGLAALLVFANVFVAIAQCPGQEVHRNPPQSVTEWCGTPYQAGRPRGSYRW